MKPMQFFNSENDDSSEKTFSNTAQSSNILLFAMFVAYYNSCTNQLNEVQ